MAERPLPPDESPPANQPRWIRPSSLIALHPEQFPATLAASPWATDRGSAAATAVRNTAGTTHPYSLPWDWRTATRGQQGESLPRLAVSWDPLGNPYYGSGVVGWARGAISRITAPIEERRSFREIPLPPGLAQAIGRPELGGTPGVMGAAQSAAEDLDIIAQRAGNLSGTPGTAPTGIDLVGRVTRELIGLTLQGFMKPAEATETVLGQTRGIEAAGEGSPLPSITGAMERSAQAFGGEEGPENIPRPLRQAAAWVATAVATLLSAMPPFWGYNAVRVATSGRSRADLQTDLGNSLEASRMLYSQFLDPGLRAEFVRQVDAGYDAQLVAMELENPIAEGVGQLIFDPLNVIGPTAGRNALRSRFLNQSDEFLRIADEGVEGAFRAAESVASGARTPEMIRGLARAHTAALIAKETGQVAANSRFGLFALTSSGRRFVISRRAGDLLGWIAHTIKARGGNIDEILELLRGIGLAAGRSEDEVAEGLAIMMRFDDPAPLFSEAGNELSVLLRGVMTGPEGYNPAAFSRAVMGTNSVGAMVHLASERVGTIIDQMNPSVTDRVGAAARIAELERTGQAVPAYLRGWAQSAANLPPYIRSLARFDTIAQSRLYRPVNSFFASIYMGMSPGYAFRNGVQNTLHTLVDYGLEPFRHGPKAWEEIGARWLGGQVISGSRMGYGAAEAANISRGSDIFNFARRWSEGFERSSSARVVGASIERSMRQMLRPGRALPDVTPLIRAGMEPETAQYLMRLVTNNYGDVHTAVTALREAVAAGHIEAWRTLNWMSPREIGFMRDLNLYDEVVEILGTASTREELAQRLGALQDEVLETARAAGREVPAMAREDEAASAVAALEEARHAGYGTDEANDAFQTARVAEREARNAFDAAGEEALAGAVRRGERTPEELLALRRQYGLTDLYQGAYAEADRVRNSTWSWTNRIRSMSDNTDWASIWRRLRIGGEPPEGLDRRGLLSSLWDYYRVHQNELFRQTHEQYITLAEQYIADLAQGGETRLLTGAREAAERARVFDGVTIPVGQVAEAAAPAAEAVAGVAPTVVRAVARPMGEGIPSMPRVIAEQQRGIERMFQKLIDGADANWGQLVPTAGGPEVETALRTWEGQAATGIADARLAAGRVANAARDFTLLAYPEKRYVDLALAYIYPYQFWYNRTYANWLRRIVYEPHVIAAYAKYHEMLATIHADMPAWWQQTINSNELLGLDSENPLFFNLEATLNPLNGMTGVDFNDPYKRTSWFGAFLDDLGKFGPSTWTPFSIAMAVGLYSQGEEEAAARWAGRLFPQTATIESMTALLTGGRGVETDPFVHIFSGGIDPYERRRVGRALGAMAGEGLVDGAAAIDAAWRQSGPVWEQARTRAVQERAPGQLASFWLGVGFRPRTVSDMTIDRFYDAYYRLQTLEPTMSPEEFRDGMDQLRQEYPFMDPLLLSRPADTMDRDRAYAYNVLGRIPPSQTDDYAGWAGIPQELLTAFYDSKGRLDQWGEAERERFMQGIISLGAVLDLPPDATRQDWGDARDTYNHMMDSGEQMLGEGIWDQVDEYYGLRGDSAEEIARANQFLEANPRVTGALDFRAAAVMQDPLLAQYYASMAQVESYYRGRMYAQIEHELGDEVWDRWDEYWAIRNADGNYQLYYRDHPELHRYGEIRDDWEDRISRRLVQFGLTMPERPEAVIREGAGGGLQDEILQQLETAQAPRWASFGPEEWAVVTGPSLMGLILDSFAGEDLPSAANTQLDILASNLGISREELLQTIDNAYNQQ